ncbi:UNVERIFIED_CONTAM: hypothetical protein FKN15_058123 [Acipenser sinensis]
MAQVLAKKTRHLCPGQRAFHSPPASAVLDETCCCRIMCQHPLCWEAHLRCARGVPRYTAARAEPPEPQEDGLPTLKIQNIPGWSDDDPDGTDLGPFPRTFSSSEPSHFTAAHTKECSVIERQTNSKPALLLSGKSERICISELIYSLPPSQTDKAHKMKRKKPFKLSHSVSLSTGGRKMAKQSIWAGRTERDSDVAQAEAVEPQPAQNKAARPKQQHGEQPLLQNRGVVLHSARGKKQSLEAGSGQGPGGSLYRLDNKSTDSPGKDKVDWESLGRQPLLWRRYLMSASRGKSKTAGPKSSRQLSQPLDPWVNFGIYSSSRDTMENIHPGQLPILEIGPALPSCSAWTKDSRRSSYDAEGSTVQPTHLPDSAASSGLSPHSTAQLLQHAMCPSTDSPGKDKVDWESLGRQPLLWRRYLMSASRGKSKTAGPKSSRQLSQPLDPWVNFGIYSSSRDTMENIHPGQLPILEIGPALPSCSAWAKDSRRSSYDAEGSTAQPTHLPDSAASSGLSPHSTAQLLQHAMCPARRALRSSRFRRPPLLSPVRKPVFLFAKVVHPKTKLCFVRILVSAQCTSNNAKKSKRGHAIQRLY